MIPGKNDGSVKGVRYFTCNPKHGKFVRAEKVLLDKRGRSIRPIMSQSTPGPVSNFRASHSASMNQISSVMQQQSIMTTSANSSLKRSTSRGIKQNLIMSPKKGVLWFNSLFKVNSNYL